MAEREATLSRRTLETSIDVHVYIDGTGEARVSTGQGFFDHLLRALSVHSLIDLSVTAKADLETGCHHLLEDCGLAIGRALSEARASGPRVRRFGHAIVPMDEALARVAIDLSGRPLSVVDMECGEAGGVGDEDAAEFIRGLAVSLGATIHVDLIRSRNAHHAMEAVYKALGICLRQALEADPRRQQVPSTKGDVLVDRQQAV